MRVVLCARRRYDSLKRGQRKSQLPAAMFDGKSGRQGTDPVEFGLAHSVPPTVIAAFRNGRETNEDTT